MSQEYTVDELIAVLPQGEYDRIMSRVHAREVRQKIHAAFYRRPDGPEQPFAEVGDCWARVVGGPRW
jgi:hypothetical protein